MKKNCILGILFGLTTLIQSCKKSSITEPIIQTINADIKVNQSYQLDLGSFSMEEDAGISKQATHFLASSLSRQSSGNISNITYKYIPATNFVGKDEVELTITKASNGMIPNTTVTHALIKITISN